MPETFVLAQDLVAALWQLAGFRFSTRADGHIAFDVHLKPDAAGDVVDGAASSVAGGGSASGAAAGVARPSASPRSRDDHRALVRELQVGMRQTLRPTP